jgi:hypothetical protein
MTTIRAGKTLLRKISLPFTKRGATYRAGQFLKSKVAEPTETITRITEETIGNLPPAVASGEKRLIQLYKSLIGQDPKTDIEAIESLSKSILKLESNMRKLGYGSPELLTEITRKRVAAIELKMDNRIMNAVRNAESKLEKLPIAQRKGQEAEIVRNEIESAMRQERTELRALWKEVPKDYEVGFEETRATYQAIKGDLAKAQRVDIPSSLRGSDIITNKKLESTTVREMQGLRSKLLERARQARKDNQWNKARIAEEVSDAILEDLGIAAGQADSGAAAALQTALAATRQFKTKFETRVVRTILGYSKSGAPAIDPSLTLDISIGRMGQRGAVDISKVAVSPEARMATEGYLARSFTDYASDIAKGTINPIKAERWIKNNEAILDQFSKLRNQMVDANEAHKLAARTQIAMEARKKVLRDPQISVSARWLNAADLNMQIDTVMKSRNPLGMTNELVRQARKDTSGRALRGLRAGYVDYLLDKSAIGAFNELGEQTLSGRTLLNLINKTEPVLHQVFDLEQIGRMKRIGAELAKIETFDKTIAGKPKIEMEDIASSSLKLFSRVGGAQIGRWVAKVTGGGTVQTPGIFSERFKAFANFLNKDRAAQLVHDAIVSDKPDLLKALLLPIDKPLTEFGIKNLFSLNKQINIWLESTGRRVVDDIADEIESDRAKEK